MLAFFVLVLLVLKRYRCIVKSNPILHVRKVSWLLIAVSTEIPLTYILSIEGILL